MLAALCLSPEARSQTTATDPLEALASMQTFVQQSVWGCKYVIYNSADGIPRIRRETLRVTGNSISFECQVPWPVPSSVRGAVESFRYRYADYPTPRFMNNMEGYHLCLQQTGCVENFKIAGAVRRQADVQQSLLGAWSALAQRRNAVDPASDPLMQNLTSVADLEQLRRVQVQVEVAMRDNRNVDAARLYRDALRTTPAWADGHYNLGLLYGELELYPEAITEMQRYLYLTPNASDARAVQDKIYEWEAAMAAGPR